MSALLKQIKVVQLETAELRNQHFEGADFSKNAKPHLRAIDCEFSRCYFDKANLSDFRSWGSRFIDCTFRETNLRNAAIGGVNEGKLNFFERADFSDADLRGIACGLGNFVDCVFNNTRLDKVDFQGSRFIRCKFSGTLTETMFYANAFRGEAFPPNQMEDVDFSDAKLHLVAFRKLNLDRIEFPKDKNHIVFDNYVEFLQKSVTELSEASPIGLRQLHAVLDNYLKWIGPKQVCGVINRLDWEAYTGALEKFDELVAKFGRLSNTRSLPKQF